ncbi:MAG: tetratricopeptide repeat protein [Chryseolinea sp.]
MKFSLIARTLLLILLIGACKPKIDDAQLKTEIVSLGLDTGEIALCRSDNTQFGKVSFDLACSENAKKDFQIGAALLHSFEYPEAEKVFAKIIDQDPHCVMAYWGAAMCNFHPLWEPPSQADLAKGARVIKLARSLVTDQQSRESHWLETIATIYDQWDSLDHKTRVSKFQKASEELYLKYPEDNEAAIFYALALRAASDPKDKTFVKQKKAGEILNAILSKEPDHPGVAHYIIHVYDYPELADLGLKSAMKYASLAAASAHAQHMPSHIFTRLGLWDESIKSNTKSVDAAKCYAENVGIKGHWDEELHGLDYLMYAHLQQGDDASALKEFQYFKTIDEVFPMNAKDAYSFASLPARYAVERKDWKSASQLELVPKGFPWDHYYWERSNIDFARFLGDIHSNNIQDAREHFGQLKMAQQKLADAKDIYKANLVLIQVKAAEGWLNLVEGNKAKAVELMSAAADLEDATEKHPVSPGSIIPARELLGDMYLKTGNLLKALNAYEASLKRNPKKFNSLYGAAYTSEQSGNVDKGIRYYQELIELAKSSGSNRDELTRAEKYIKDHQRSL